MERQNCVAHCSDAFSRYRVHFLQRVGLAFALTALPLAASAQARSGTRAIERELLRREDGWAAALVKRDVAYFQRNLAPGFVYTEDDRLMTRDAVLKDATTTTDTVTAAHNEDMVVHVAGGSTAVVTGYLIVEGRSGGAAFVHRYRFTDTWAKLGGRWQMVAAQDYLIPAAK